MGNLDPHPDLAESADTELLGALAPYVAERHRSTIGVLIWAFRTGRQLEAWLHDTLSVHDLDTSEYAALTTLWLDGPPHRLAASAIADRIVQTSGGNHQDSPAVGRARPGATDLRPRRWPPRAGRA